MHPELSVGLRMRARSGWAFVGLMAWLLPPVAARADTCRIEDEVKAASADRRYTFEAHHDHAARSWMARWEDTKTGAESEGKLEGPGWHLHPRAFVSDDGTRIVLFNTSGGTEAGNRLQIYDGSLKLLGNFGLKELLTDEERGKVRISISHCQFLGGPEDPKLPPMGLEPGGKVFFFHTMDRRKVRVALAKPAVLAEKPRGP